MRETFAWVLDILMFLRQLWSVQGTQRQRAQSTQSMEATGSQPWQHMQGKPSTVNKLEAQPEPAGRLPNSAQQSAYSGTEYHDIPSQEDMAAQIYSGNPALPKQAAQGVPKPGPKAAALSKWVPFHAVASKLPTAARPAEAGGATYLTPSEVQAIGKSLVCRLLLVKGAPMLLACPYKDLDKSESCTEQDGCIP